MTENQSIPLEGDKRSPPFIQSAFPAAPSHNLNTNSNFLVPCIVRYRPLFILSAETLPLISAIISIIPLQL